MNDAVLLLRAAAAWLGALVTVGAAMVLRADSDGPAPGWPILLLAVVVLAALLWPMTSGRRRLPTFAMSLVGLQLATHAFLLYATTGRVGHSGASGLLCCPATPVSAHAGPLATLTANAGCLLLLVQLVVVLALAVPLRLIYQAFLHLGQALGAMVSAALPLLTHLFAPVAPPGHSARRPRAPRRLGGTARQVAGAVRRRGPPVSDLVRSSVNPLSLTGMACAA